VNLVKRFIPLVAVALLLGACSPAQYRDWLRTQGHDPAQYSEQEINDGAAMATAYWTMIIAQIQEAERAKATAFVDRFAGSVSADGLARLRACESGGNYNIVSPGGAYRGAYQFSRSTWNAVAGRHYPQLVGVDPAAAEPMHQDAMARALYAMQGRGPWPVCGRRI
jgi:hypothetical protein